jgi:flagellar hook-basal body complex protein FliE
MTTAALTAVRAYEAQARALDQDGPTPATQAGTGFAALLDSAMTSAREVGGAADAGLAAQAVGKAEVVDVVTAVAEAELTVQTIVAVRDRVISAYQEILRMPI